VDCSLIVLKMRWQLDCIALLSILCCAMGEKSTLMIHTQVPGQVSPIILNTSLPGCFRHSALHLIGERGFNSDGREGRGRRLVHYTASKSSVQVPSNPEP